MDGIKLYKELSKRDYSGSESDSYAQLLRTLFFNVQDNLFPILKSAHDQGKKLRLKNESLQNGEFTMSDISMS